MQRMRSRKEVDDLFSDPRFEVKIIEQEWAAITNSEGDIIRLIIVVYPPNDMLQYRVEMGTKGIKVYSKFADAIKAFRELV